jgi:hypothetical protein
MSVLGNWRLEILAKLIKTGKPDGSEENIYLLEYLSPEPLCSLPVVPTNDIGLKDAFLASEGEVVDPGLGMNPA